MHRLHEKSHAVRDPDARNRWRNERDRCYVCGIPTWKMYGERFPAWMQVHHIIKPGRSDEPCNLFAVCARCHRVIEGERVPCGKRVYLPKLTLGMVLTIKQAADPDEWNPDRLVALYHRLLPDREFVPEYYLEERDRWGVVQ